jgi:hypothetical protein
MASDMEDIQYNKATDLRSLSTKELGDHARPLVYNEVFKLSNDDLWTAYTQLVPQKEGNRSGVVPVFKEDRLETYRTKIAQARTNAMTRDDRLDLITKSGDMCCICKNSLRRAQVGVYKEDIDESDLLVKLQAMKLVCDKLPKTDAEKDEAAKKYAKKIMKDRDLYDDSSATGAEDAYDDDVDNDDEFDEAARAEFYQNGLLFADLDLI